MAYRCKNGVCVPTDLAQVGVFKGLQRAVNAVIDYSCSVMPGDDSAPVYWKTCMHVSPVAVDGKIGPKTAEAALSLVFTELGDQFPQLRSATQAADLAPYASQVAAALTALINQPVDASAAPRWLAVVSPPVWYAWATRPFWER
jgi:hypothetical protein